MLPRQSYRSRTAAMLLLVSMAAYSTQAQPVPGDFDDDRDVDVFDHASFVDCQTGPGGGTLSPSCQPGDFDGDQDIDLLDWGTLQTKFGTGQSPRIDRFEPTPGEWIVDDIGLSQVVIGFDRSVVVPSDATTAWSVNAGSITPASTSYDDVTHALTMTFTPPIENDRATIIIDYAITDADGNELDGEIADPNDATLPSGDSVRGGQAVFRINVLQGDANRDGLVDAADEALIQAALDTCAGDPEFDPNADLNADGCVNQQDLDIFTPAQGNVLPALDGTPPQIQDRAPDIDERFRDHDLNTVVATFSEDLSTMGLSPSSLFVLKPGGFIQSADALSVVGATATFTFEAPPPPNQTYRFNLSNAFADASGDLLSPDAVTKWQASIDDTPTTIIQTSPTSAEGMVALTRETIITFRDTIQPDQTLTTNDIKAEFAGQILGMTANSPRITLDGKHIKLFYDPPLPPSARVRVTIDGSNLLDDLGNVLDADGDGQPGGMRQFDFDTCTVSRIPNTVVFGHIFASEQQGPNGEDIPIEGVTIRVDGFPSDPPCDDGLPEGEFCAQTDANGFFWLGGPPPTLSPDCELFDNFCFPASADNTCFVEGAIPGVPAPEFFVHVDGTTATAVGGQPITGGFYPNVGKTFKSTAGHCLQIAVNNQPFDLYLPLVADNALLPVSQNGDTVVQFEQDAIDRFCELFPGPDCAQQAQLTQLSIPQDSLQNDDGSPGNMAGIFPIDSTRLPGPLPGDQVHSFDITVQTDGATNFDLPTPLCLPNVPDRQTGERLHPGEKTGLVSFNHDIGKWEFRGGMTAGPDEDGDGFAEAICPDEGVGVAAPGWHGQVPGTPVEGEGAACPLPSENSSPSLLPASSASNGCGGSSGCDLGQALKCVSAAAGAGGICGFGFGTCVILARIIQAFPYFTTSLWDKLLLLKHLSQDKEVVDGWTGCCSDWL